MIRITEKANCCGCSACVQSCPKHCISISEDKEGFLYPKVDIGICIDCGLCEKVCPVLHQGAPRTPIHVYAAKNKNEEIRRQSSSGGVFTLLAEQVIEAGGVVFGARFDENWEVKHDYTETKEGLAAFRGSKYVQSRIENTYQEAKQFLGSGRLVLFSGTPCQIAGLKIFLRKEYDNLLLVDFICHGVPSPKVWRMYLDETAGNRESIQYINFRDKTYGWKKYAFALNHTATKEEAKILELSSRNTYIKGFLSDLYLRPSCYICPSKELKSGSDLTIADFWGIQRVMPKIDDNKGLSVVIENTTKVANFINTQDLSCWEANYEDVLTYNPSIAISSKKHRNRERFFEEIQYRESVYRLILKYNKHPFLTRLTRKAKSLMLKALGGSGIRVVKGIIYKR
ncbi:coenzyme F420-reducing hydrogenase beta subunit [Parabacteroides sp. PFB2-12]|uniref:Coenzyme F420 hydrogenase/dehydrogenase, beta subunit C-terminal domain n=1 Tax=unclassified Parabacteroides TaxID=2649774 RepID=UPI0024766E9A|nr:MULTISPECIES: Coenzyme F420 hydrogenase/dehydrogenase, beta subunit C-terminal domain [unclassified Parabacteroides]MDH6342250.1 coenzyme F420-reducing hydrogenase beta subunit [Parabacteroides sp. PM6-13]MDH6390593.1 coenzyme F420-reducing hydrogenase beta subunit [Parabacteroides sp. PFB2-12]